MENTTKETTVVSATTVTSELRATLETMFNKNKRLTSDFIKENKLSKKVVNGYNDALKLKKAQKRLDAISLEKCAIIYNNNVITFKPSLTKSEGGTDIVCWKNLDKNAICYAIKGEDGNVAYKIIANVTEKSMYYDVRCKEVNANRSFVNSIIKEVFDGMSWDAFYAKVSGWKNIKTINCPSVLKSL